MLVPFWRDELFGSISIFRVPCMLGVPLRSHFRGCFFFLYQLLLFTSSYFLSSVLKKGKKKNKCECTCFHLSGFLAGSAKSLAWGYSSNILHAEPNMLQNWWGFHDQFSFLSGFAAALLQLTLPVSDCSVKTCLQAANWSGNNLKCGGFIFHK